jgi:IS6 family transposase
MSIRHPHAGKWRYVYRAIDDHGQVIDVFVSNRRDTTAATQFFATAFRDHGEPDVVTTDKAWTLARALDELAPQTQHVTTQYANNPIESDHARLKARLQPMRGLKRDRTAATVIRGRALIQNLRRSYYELAIQARAGLTVAAAFDDLPGAL